MPDVPVPEADSRTRQIKEIRNRVLESTSLWELGEQLACGFSLHFILIKVYFNKMKLEENPGHYPHLPPTPGTPVILSFRTAFICGVAVRLERMSVGGPRF